MNTRPTTIAANTAVCAQPPRASLPQLGLGSELRQSLSGRSSGKNSLIVGRVVSSSSVAARRCTDGGSLAAASDVGASSSRTAASKVVVKARILTPTVYHRGS